MGEVLVLQPAEDSSLLAGFLCWAEMALDVVVGLFEDNKGADVRLQLPQIFMGCQL